MKYILLLDARGAACVRVRVCVCVCVRVPMLMSYTGFTFNCILIHAAVFTLETLSGNNFLQMWGRAQCFMVCHWAQMALM